MKTWHQLCRFYLWKYIIWFLISRPRCRSLHCWRDSRGVEFRLQNLNFVSIDYFIPVEYRILPPSDCIVNPLDCCLWSIPKRRRPQFLFLLSRSKPHQLFWWLSQMQVRWFCVKHWIFSYTLLNSFSYIWFELKMRVS